MYFGDLMDQDFFLSIIHHIIKNLVHVTKASGMDIVFS